MLDWLCFVAVRHDHSARSDVNAYPAAVWSVTQWLGRHLEPGEDWVDEKLTLRQAFEVGESLIKKASLPDDLLGGIREWAKIVGAGGCSCPRCDDPDKFDGIDDKKKAIILIDCKFSDVGDEVYSIVGATRAARGGDLLKAPWWLYQIDNAVETGLHLGRKKKDTRQSKSDRMKKALGKKGL